MKYLIKILILVLVLAMLPMHCSLAANSGVYYEVFVRAFADSNGDGIGDIVGLTNKLDYLQSLGIKGLWLMPIFKSASYHGYDIIDYKAVNPEYGSMQQFEHFINEAHKRDISILLDIAFNHTSTQHPWFISSINPNNEKHSWYRWSDTAKTKPDIKQQVWGHNVWVPKGDNYYYALFWEGMPDLNLDSASLKQELLNTAKFWLNKGVDGFRLDATSHIYAQGEDGVFQNVNKSSSYWQEFYKEIKIDYPKAYIIGEAWEDLKTRAELLKGMDSCVNFDIGTMLGNMVKMGGSAKQYATMLEDIYKAYYNANKNYIDSPFLSNHDKNRIFASLGYKLNRAKLAANILLSLPGNPIIYYGEEIGMAGAKPDEELRTPMLWGNDDSATTSWHTSKYNNKTKSVFDQQSDEDSLYNHYKQLISIRNKYPAFSYGEFKYYNVNNDKVFAYTLEYNKQILLCLHNYNKQAQSIVLPEGEIVYGHSENGTIKEYNSIIIKLN